MEEAKKYHQSINELVSSCENIKLLRHINKLVEDIVTNNDCTKNGEPYKKEGEYLKAYVRERIAEITPEQRLPVAGVIDVYIDKQRLEEAEAKAKN